MHTLTFLIVKKIVKLGDHASVASVIMSFGHIDHTTIRKHIMSMLADNMIFHQETPKGSRLRLTKNTAEYYRNELMKMQWELDREY